MQSCSPTWAHSNPNVCLIEAVAHVEFSVDVALNPDKGSTSTVGYLSFGPSMRPRSLSAPTLAGAQLQVCRTVAQGVTLSGSLKFFGGSFSSSLCVRKKKVAWTASGWRRTARDRSGSMPSVKAIGDPSQSTFLSLEEAGLIEMTNLDMHEKFLARLTVSSLNLLKEISEQEGIPIDELNAGKLCDWFVRDKEKREENVEDATLKWNTPEW